MHIAIDKSPLEGGHSGRGTGVYTRLIISALQKYKPKHTYTLFTRVQDIPENTDIVHFPYFDLFFLTLPLVKPHKTVVTVHDLIPLVYPEHFPPGFRGHLKWWIQRLSLRQSAHILTDSRASKKDIHQIAGIDNDQITVVPLAADEKFNTFPSKKVLEYTKKYHQLPDSFFLYVGDVNWNKNIPGLLTALSLFPDAHLVLVGKAFIKQEIPEVQAIDHKIDELGLSGRVHRIGFVSDDALMALYTLADACVIPSFAEGFGLPVLEAMACKTPTVVASGSSLDEIAGPSIRVDSADPHDIARGINEALSINRDEWKKKAAAWTHHFTWQKVATQTVEVYEKVYK